MSDPAQPAFAVGTLVTVRWDPQGRTKRARWVRWTRTGSAVVQVEAVDGKGRPTGEWGAPRTFAAHDILGEVAV